MDLNALKALDSGDIAALIELVQDYRDGVANGDITGFHQPALFELADASALLAKLRAVLDN